MTAFSLDGAGLVAGVNVPTIPELGPCDHPLSYSHAVDLLLAMEADAERKVGRIRAELHDVSLRSRAPDRLAGMMLAGVSANEAKIGERLGEAVVRWEALRDCVSALLRHQRRHDHDDVAETLVAGGAQLEIEVRRAGWERFIAMEIMQESE